MTAHDEQTGVSRETDLPHDADIPASADLADSVVATDGLWPGDTGTLPAQVRSALVQLIRGPYVSARRTPNHWATLLAHESVIRSRLADVWLDLALDEDREVAFARNAPAEGESVPQMMRKQSLSFVDTALLLYLRHQLLRAAAAGERAYVGLDELTEHIQQYRVDGNHDHAIAAKRVKAAVDRFVKYALLDRTDTEGRYEIMSILGLVVTADLVAGIEAEYRAIREGVRGGTVGSADGADGVVGEEWV